MFDSNITTGTSISKQLKITWKTNLNEALSQAGLQQMLNEIWVTAIANISGLTTNKC